MQWRLQKRLSIKNNEETPGFQLAQVRGTLAHVVNLQPHQLNLAILLSGGQCSDAYKKRLSTKNNEETPCFQPVQIRGTLAHVVNLHPHQLNLATLLSGGQCSDA